jgi:Fuc2NAc and GlcNAc transferase
MVFAAIALADGHSADMWAVAGLTTLIAVLGFADDLNDLPAALRFPVQLVIVAALLLTLGPLPAVAMPLGLTLNGWLLGAATLLVGLWWLNLFNFMDGIDAIAGSHAVLILTGAATIWWTTDTAAAASPLFWLAIAGACAAAGFLLRNWPPARIFMGDAGSNSLALVIFAIALATVAADMLAYEPWLILPAVFVTDASVTLLRRLARGERPWQAHRRHAYQQLSRLWGHQRVTLIYCAVTALWAWPLALAAQHVHAFAWAVVILAYAPLLGLALWADAGGADEKASSPGPTSPA